MSERRLRYNINWTGPEVSQGKYAEKKTMATLNAKMEGNNGYNGNATL